MRTHDDAADGLVGGGDMIIRTCLNFHVAFPETWWVRLLWSSGRSVGQSFAQIELGIMSLVTGLWAVSCPTVPGIHCNAN